MSSKSEKFLVYLVLFALFVSKIAVYYLEYLLLRYFSRSDIHFKTEFLYKF